MLFLVSRKAKYLALRHLFPFNNTKRGLKDGVADIRLNNATLATKHPLIFADSDPFAISLPSINVISCHETALFPV